MAPRTNWSACNGNVPGFHQRWQSREGPDFRPDSSQQPIRRRSRRVHSRKWRAHRTARIHRPQPSWPPPAKQSADINSLHPKRLLERMPLQAIYSGPLRVGLISSSHLRRFKTVIIQLGWRREIDEISIRVTEINGTSSPRLCGRWLNPSFHSALQSSVLLIDIGDPEFQDDALVLCCLSRARKIPLLSLFRENRQHSYARRKLGIIVTRPLRSHGQDGL